jgi:hypothetical protein
MISAVVPRGPPDSIVILESVRLGKSPGPLSNDLAVALCRVDCTAGTLRVSECPEEQS